MENLEKAHNRLERSLRRAGLGDEVVWWYFGGRTIVLDDSYTAEELRAIAQGLESFIKEEGNGQDKYGGKLP